MKKINNKYHTEKRNIKNTPWKKNHMNQKERNIHFLKNNPKKIK